jgi:hypothetical protein
MNTRTLPTPAARPPSLSRTAGEGAKRSEAGEGRCVTPIASPMLKKLNARPPFPR